MNHGKISKEIATGLIELRKRIDAAKIPSSKIDETLNIATWNIREFGKKLRAKAALHYIAEILGQFDLIGLVELRDDLTDLGKVLDILGPYWRAVYSEMIPDAGGNRERIGYLYDKRSVVFNGMASALYPPRVKRGEEYIAEISWWRAPYIASFRSGNFDFLAIAAHIRWGSGEHARLGELEKLAEWVERKREQKTAEDKDIIVMGDFNIPSTDGPLFEAITSRGLVIPVAIRKLKFGSNLAKDKRYDQILHLPLYPESFCNAGGILDFYDGDFAPLLGNITKEKATFQLSDHLPLWIQINTDTDDQKLEQIIKG